MTLGALRDAWSEMSATTHSLTCSRFLATLEEQAAREYGSQASPLTNQNLALNFGIYK